MRARAARPAPPPPRRRRRPSPALRRALPWAIAVVLATGCYGGVVLSRLPIGQAILAAYTPRTSDATCPDDPNGLQTGGNNPVGCLTFQDPVGLGCRRDHDLGLLPVHLVTIGSAVLDGVVHQIGKRLTDELAVAMHRDRRGGIDLEMDAALVRDRLIEFADGARDFSSIEIGHPVARLA